MGHNRVVLAILISFVAFLIILGLDKIADLSCTTSTTDNAIFSIITALGVLVGFAWEQSFDGGLEIVSELTPHPIKTELMLAIFVAAIVIEPWRRYILKQVLHHMKAWEERNAMNEEGEEDLPVVGGNPWGDDRGGAMDHYLYDAYKGRGDQYHGSEPMREEPQQPQHHHHHHHQEQPHEHSHEPHLHSQARHADTGAAW
eukprot:NODE_1011_length_1269_cov_325.932455.p2 GENE.NODE_1011_length_1269_cov_325.932455~~NODE_1011_length_1269_cov_325.932455.p2  ORF type:complete len:212 (-),score=53.76 NODE_1011_length_1269_cov_325.932455:619-1218(-)